MTPIKIPITIQGRHKLLTIPQALGSITTQLDAEAQTLSFLRPEGYEDDTMILTFLVGDAVFETPVVDDTFALTPAITQYGKVDMWVTFERDGQRSESTNKCTFGARDFPNVDMPPSPPVPPKEFVTTLPGSISYIRENDLGQFVYFSPMLQEERVLAGGGGPGGDEVDPYYNRDKANIVFRDELTQTMGQEATARESADIALGARIDGIEPGISEAPSDGSIYGRKDGVWETVSAGTETDPVFVAAKPLLATKEDVAQSILVEAQTRQAADDALGYRIDTMVGGTNDHSMLINRETPNQHPMSAVMGLTEAFTPVTQHIADFTKHVSESDRALWNGKSSFSGSWNDLTNKPDLNTDIVLDTTFTVVNQTTQGNLTLHNPITGETRTVSRNIPIASAGVTGLMPKEDAASMVSFGQRISALERSTSRYSVTIPTDPTQAQLQTLYETAADISPGTVAADGTRLVDTDTGVMFEWFSADNLWHVVVTPGAATATNHSLGVVMGSPDPAEDPDNPGAVYGKIYVETDGSGSLIGWDMTQAAILERLMSNNPVFTGVMKGLKITNTTNPDSYLELNSDGVELGHTFESQENGVAVNASGVHLAGVTATYNASEIVNRAYFDSVVGDITVALQAIAGVILP